MRRSFEAEIIALWQQDRITERLVKAIVTELAHAVSDQRLQA